MNVHDLLKDMEHRALGETFADAIKRSYDADTASGAYGKIESNYREGYQNLKQILSEDQQQELERMIALFNDRRCIAAVYSFKAGLFGAFSRYFDASRDRDGGFQNLVVNELLTQPRMQRQHAFYSNCQQCNEIDSNITGSLTEEDQEHMTSVVCALQQRVYSAALDAFYCGYRAAYEIIGAIKPLARIENIDKILTMEYYLGYTKPYSEEEQVTT